MYQTEGVGTLVDLRGFMQFFETLSRRLRMTRCSVPKRVLHGSVGAHRPPILE